MSSIRVLSTEVSNKIAAGEVVERPASVVKELVENAIDAGATALTVEIKGGGIPYIRVTDNGSGMEAEDARTAFLRHATSKIANAADLNDIQTLGFRGEALASIAAVSHVELLTKTREGEGIYLRLEGGKIVEEAPAGCPEGTTIVVKDLFFNTPARMKFLKKDRTETGYITDIVERLVLSNPSIRLTYLVDGVEKLFFAGDGSLQSCIYSVYGSEYAKKSAPISRNENRVTLSGFVGAGELARGNRSFQSFYVNGRYVKNKALTFAAENAFRNAIMVGKFPFFVVHIEVPFDSVDINVHPTKQEVKFADEKTVAGELYWAIKNALAQQADEIRNDMLTQPSTPLFQRPNRMEEQEYPQQQWRVDTAPTAAPQRAAAAEAAEKAAPIVPEYKKQHASHHSSIPSGSAAVEQPLSLREPVTPLIPVQVEQAPPSASHYKTVGQLFDTYIVIELEGQIVLIDQHAAHERLLYEKLVALQRQRQPMPQILLSPVVVTLSPKEQERLKDRLPFLQQIGFEVEDFGSNSVLVRQAPADMGTEGLKEFLLELISRPTEELTSERELDALHTVACKAAVKGNMKLSAKEVDVLMDELLSTGGINTCPHGRPIMIKITRYELEKMFKRIQ